MKRRALACLLASTMIYMTMAPICGASYIPEQQETISIYRTVSDRLETETTLVVYDSMIRSSTRRAEKNTVYKYDGVEIASVTLEATFSYDGNTAQVVSASGSHTTSGGWSYKSESISKSGDTAELTAKLTKLLYPALAVEISMTCTPSGQIS